jgi:hypothetical protein
MKKILLSLILAVSALVLFGAGTGQAHASGLASIVAGVNVYQANGSEFAATDYTVNVQVWSTRSNSSKGSLASGGCYLCRTGSTWKDGDRLSTADTTVASKSYTVNGTGGGWGVHMSGSGEPDYQWGCGNSTCGTDAGTCNPFAVKTTITSFSNSGYNDELAKGFFFRYEYDLGSDPGSTGGTGMSFVHSTSKQIDINVKNDDTAYLRVDWHFNRAPSDSARTISYQAVGQAASTSKTIPANNVVRLTLPEGYVNKQVNMTGLTNVVTDPDGDSVASRMQMPVQTNRATAYDSGWSGLAGSGYTFNYALSSAFQSAATAGTVKTYYIDLTGKDAHGDVSGTVRVTVELVVDPPRTMNSCIPEPDNGLGPLVVKVTADYDNLVPENVFSYDFNTDGTYEYTGKGSQVYYTYDPVSTTTTKRVTVRHIDSRDGVTRYGTCEVTINPDSSSEGGETR